jgi:DNA-binding transcriptional ArsR family regulator
MATRPTPTRSAKATGSRATTPLRPPVRDFAGGGSVAVEWDVRPVFDFMFSLSAEAGSTDDLPAEDRHWLTSAKAALPADIRAEIKALTHTELAIHVASFAIEHPNLRTVTDLLAGLEAAPTLEVMLAVVGDYGVGSDAEAIARAAIAGDKQALADLTAVVGEHDKSLIDLVADPERTRDRILTVLQAWATPFKEIEDRIAAIGRRDYEMRAGDRATMANLDLIERTTGGVRWLPTTGIGRVILGPSYFSRPYNFLLGGDGWRFFGYPVADDALDPGDPLAPPPSVVRLHRALGDLTRMRILRLLADRDLYATEIAQALDLSKPTIKHHLALLRAAGLVTITESGAVVYYSLRRNRLDDASSELKRFLGA